MSELTNEVIAQIKPKIAKAHEHAGNVVASGQEYVVGGSEKIRGFLDEVGDLQRILQLLAKVLEENPKFAIPGLLNTIAGCEIDLKWLESKIVIAGTLGVPRVVAWPLRDSKTKEYTKQIEQHKTRLNSVLNEMQLLVGRDELDFSRRLQNAIQRVEDQLAIEFDERRRDARRVEDKREQTILQWIFPEQIDATLRGIMEKRKGAGRWLLEHPVYQAWISAEPPANILWCSGIPGSGKTYLTSFVIEHLQTHTKNPGNGLAYLFFQHSESEQQTPTQVLSSLLKQLATQNRRVFTLAENLYEKFAPAQRRPMQQDLLDVVVSALGYFTNVYIVFDALDECNEEKVRKILLPLIERLACAKASIYLTSRQNPQDIQGKFGTANKIEIKPSDDDIRAYVNDVITSSPRAKYLAQIEREDLISKLINCASGMFIMVKFKMDHLCQQPTRKRVLNELEKLKDDKAGEKLLDEAYSRILRFIQTQEDERSKLAFAALTWLAHAKRTFTVEELSMAISIKPGIYEPDFDDLVDAITLLDICGGFVVVDDATQLVHLAHSTIREFLTRTVEEIKYGRDIPLFCLTYLSYECFQGGHCQDQESFNERLTTYPLFAYIGRYLETHIHDNAQGVEEPVVEALSHLLMQQGNLESYIQVSHAPDSSEYGFDWYPRGTSPMHVLASIGIAFVAINNIDDVSVKNSLKQTPLHIASMKGRLHIVKILLQAGVDVFLQDDRGYTSLCWAVWNGHGTVVEEFLLLGDKIQPLLDLRTNLNESVLHLAVSRDKFDIAVILIKKGVNINLVDQERNTALHLAAKKGRFHMVKLLLESGATTTIQNKKDWTACDESKFAGFEDIVDLFKTFSSFPTVTSRGQELVVPQNEHTIRSRSQHSRSASSSSHSGSGMVDRGHTPNEVDQVDIVTIQGADSSTEDLREVCTPQESTAASVADGTDAFPEPNICVRAEHFQRVIELSDNDCKIEDNDNELKRICGEEFIFISEKHWRVRLEAHTNLRFVTNAVPHGNYVVLWKFAYKINDGQGSLQPEMVKHNLSAGLPVNTAMFLSRITDPAQPYISTGLDAIINPRVMQTLTLPRHEWVPNISIDTWGLKLRREDVIDLVDGQIMSVKDGDEVAFLVKRVKFTPEIKGFLMFLGVVLIRIPLQTRPNQYI